VNRTKLIDELAAILSKPIYRTLIDRGNEYAESYQHNAQLRKFAKNKSLTPTPYKSKDAEDFAEEAVDSAFGNANKPNLVEPILAVELAPAEDSISLYRLYDGISSKTALTLGRWWCNRRLMKQICYAASDTSGRDREVKILGFMRSAMFVHPSWNYGTEVAQMEIPVGGRLPALVAKGSWQAMSSHPDIQTEDDVIDKLGMVPIPGPKQFFLPLLNDMWVRGVPKLSENWPLD
jgi:hypothetical protein